MTLLWPSKKEMPSRLIIFRRNRASPNSLTLHLPTVDYTCDSELTIFRDLSMSYLYMNSQRAIRIVFASNINDFVLAQTCLSSNHRRRGLSVCTIYHDPPGYRKENHVLHRYIDIVQSSRRIIEKMGEKSIYALYPLVIAIWLIESRKGLTNTVS